MTGPNGETHIVIARATDDAHHIEIKVGMTSQPSSGDVQQVKQNVRRAFFQAFKVSDCRVGAAVLPYVEELDSDEDESSIRSRPGH